MPPSVTISGFFEGHSQTWVMVVEGVGVEPSVADLKYDHDMVLYQARLHFFCSHATKSGFLRQGPYVVRTHSERTYYNFIENI